MRRRDFIKVIAASGAAWPLAARAQQGGRVRRVGILLSLAKDDSEEQRRVTAFVHELRDLGWTEGGNIQFDYRWTGANVGLTESAAAELVDLKPDVILAETALMLAPLRQMTTSIPIVFLLVADPVGSGFVASLARPGGNLTGFTPFEFSVSGKMLEILKEVAPQVSRVAVIYNPVQAPNVGMWNAVETAAPSLSVQVKPASAGNANEIRQIIEGFGDEPGGGMVVLPSPITIVNRGLIIALMARHHLPAVYPYPYFVREGGLVSYGSDPIVQFRQAASYVNQILKGAKPADLPVQQPTKFNLVVNLATAKALGLTISREFLLLADEVIE